MDDLLTSLEAALPAGAVTPHSDALARDVFRHDLGTPRAWVRPTCTADVVALVDFARAHRIPLVPIGQRSSYWRPLRCDGGLALDVGGLDEIEELQPRAGYLWCGAGTPVRVLDDHLRARGFVLPAHPDAFGDTSIGSMVATGFTSGVGMGVTTIDELVVGLEVVLGDGRVLRTGTGEALGSTPFMRGGLADPTGLFLASEGALGVITRVAIRPRRRCPLAMLSWKAPDQRSSWERITALAERTRVPGLYETFRAVLVRMPWGKPPIDVDLVVRAPLGVDELELRVTHVRRLVAELFGADVAETIKERRELPGQPETVQRWWGEPGAYKQLLSFGHLVGVDVNLPYDAAARCFDAADAILDDAATLPNFSRRLGVYYAPDFINLGMHIVFQTEGPGYAPGGMEVGARGMERFAELPVIPYRWGRLWGAAMGHRVDPTYLDLMRSLKATLDPDGILHPGANLWGDTGSSAKSPRD